MHMYPRTLSDGGTACGANICCVKTPFIQSHKRILQRRPGQHDALQTGSSMYYQCCSHLCGFDVVAKQLRSIIGQPVAALDVHEQGRGWGRGSVIAVAALRVEQGVTGKLY